MAEAISDRVAQDLVNEHEDRESDEEDPIVCAAQDDKCKGDVTLAPDPYSHELYDDATPVWMCEHHRIERADDK